MEAAARTFSKLLDAEHTVTLASRLGRTYLSGSMRWLIVDQRQMNHPLDESEQALAQFDWSALQDCARAVLAVGPDNTPR